MFISCEQVRDLDHLMTIYDTDKSGFVEWSELIAKIRPELNARRRKAVNDVFTELDRYPTLPLFYVCMFMNISTTCMNITNIHSEHWLSRVKVYNQCKVEKLEEGKENLDGGKKAIQYYVKIKFPKNEICS